MNTSISEKLARFGRALDIIGKVLAVFCFLAATLMLFGAIAVLLVPDDIILSVLNLFNINLTTTYTNTSPYVIAVIGAKTGVILGLVGRCILSVFYAIILLILSAFFKSTAVNKTPFTFENAKRLKIIGIILIVMSIPFGLGNLVFAFCLFAFAYVIQYGAELQQQADETL